MGSKNLKAIAFKGSLGVKIAAPEESLWVLVMAKHIKKSDPGFAFKAFGTPQSCKVGSDLFIRYLTESWETIKQYHSIKTPSM